MLTSLFKDCHPTLRIDPPVFICPEDPVPKVTSCLLPHHASKLLTRPSLFTLFQLTRVLKLSSTLRFTMGRLPLPFKFPTLATPELLYEVGGGLSDRV